MPIVGLSPRGRGNPATTRALMTLAGSIPAWAGEPDTLGRRQHQLQVYPRVGGGTASTMLSRTLSTGLSPRGRGNRITNGVNIGLSRSIPAWAGEPRHSPRTWFLGRVYPRVGGGTARVARRLRQGQGLSPRGRGNQQVFPRLNEFDGSIPAWAGEPTQSSRQIPKQRVYPRVGGGTSVARAFTIHVPGLSPRGRGNR